MRKLQVLVTVKAAPNPSEQYGETVCVAGFSTALTEPGWIRLYPINFRELERDDAFRKYDLIEIEATPARNDPRHESWRPRMNTLRRVGYLEKWPQRASSLEGSIETSMCKLVRGARNSARAKSLALIRPREILDLEIAQHPGWTREQQAKIDAYVQQEQLFNENSRTPLEAPRFQGWYRYKCSDSDCGSHRQGVLDWEFVALQRRLAAENEHTAIEQMRAKFLTMMTAPKRRPAFYVGNQAKRAHVFSVLGVYYPEHAHLGPRRR